MQTEFSYANAVECSAGEVERMILRVKVALQSKEGPTYEGLGTGDTFIFGRKSKDGRITIEDCKVRRTIHIEP